MQVYIIKKYNSYSTDAISCCINVEYVLVNQTLVIMSTNRFATILLHLLTDSCAKVAFDLC